VKKIPKDNTIISHNSQILDEALGGVEKNFKKRIISTYLELKHRHEKASFNHEYDSSGLSAGKFCETIFRFTEYELNSGNFTPFSGKITNLVKAFQEFEKTAKVLGHESLRLTIPRAVILIYTLRNKRGIGHVGGDIDANAIDGSTIVKLADWVICELIRVYHTMSFEEAQAVVDSLNTKSIPTIWEVNGKKRVLKKGLPYKDQVLLLTYSEVDNAVAVEDLFTWTQYSSLSMFRSSVLAPLHKEKLIEYDTELDFVHLSPIGISQVEKSLLSGK
jgi:hypothetical protein